MDYWLVTTGDDKEPGINGAIKHRAGGMPPVSNSIEVTSIEEAFEKVRNAGGKVITGKMGIPGVGFHAYCRDTEGNIFGLIQNL